MDIIEDYCHWCEEKITRTLAFAVWLSEDGTSTCLFHPANFDARTMTATGEIAYHQNIEEVHDIIIAEHHRRKALREKKPLHAVSDNVVILAKNAKKTSRSAAESALPKSGSIRARVYSYFKGRGDFGATDDEAQEFLGIDGNTFRPTRKSLVDDGYLFDSGGTRKNKNQNDCVVWVEREHAEAKGLFL